MVPAHMCTSGLPSPKQDVNARSDVGSRFSNNWRCSPILAVSGGNSIQKSNTTSKNPERRML